MTPNASSSPVRSRGGLATLRDEVCVPIRADADIVTAREQARQLAVETGFRKGDIAVIVAAISEITRNIVTYAGFGELVLRVAGVNGKASLVCIAKDDGPGIPDIGLALEDGYSTSGGFGLGLPGAKRLMDGFEIVSQPGKGTTVMMTKRKR